MKTCYKCNATVNEEYLFCHRCGADLKIPHCAACGKELPENAVFCPWCGKQLEQPEAPEAETEPKPEEASAQTPETPAVQAPELCFTDSAIQLLEDFLVKHGCSKWCYELRKHEKITSEKNKILWEKKEQHGGGYDVETFHMTLTLEPVDAKRVYDSSFTPGFAPSDKYVLDWEVIFQSLASAAQGDGETLVWSHIWRLLVCNPFGIGVDVLATYHYDSKWDTNWEAYDD